MTPLRKRRKRFPHDHHPNDTSQNATRYPALRAFHARQRERVTYPMPVRAA